jgi:glycerophosphoryl diester phosphodiesterase
MSMAKDQIFMPELLAHRGYAARFPENTREAIQAAVMSGARHVEFDVQLSRDGVPHLLHDEDFARTGNSPQRIFDLTADEIASLRVGEQGRFGDSFKEVCVPRLDSIAADLLDCPEVTAYVELKRHSLEHFGVPDVVAAVVASLQPVLQQCVFISFEQPAIEEARLRTGRPVGWALRNWDATSRQHAEDIRPDYLFCNVKRLPPEPAPLWEGEWTWVIYEITRPEEALSLAARGVGMIETMAFAEMHSALGAPR